MQRVTRIRREQPCHVLRLGQRRAMRQRPAQIFPQPGAHLPGEGARRFQPAGELLRTLRQPERFAPSRLSVLVFADEYEVACIRHKHQPVPVPIPADLLPGRSQERIVILTFHFDHAAFRCLALLRLAPLKLLGGVQAEVGMPSALIGQLGHAEDLGLERGADRGEQIVERRIVRPFPRGATGCAHPAQRGEVGFNRGGQACGCRCHGRLERPRDVGLRFANPTYRTPSNRESPQPAGSLGQAHQTLSPPDQVQGRL